MSQRVAAVHDDVCELKAAILKSAAIRKSGVLEPDQARTLVARSLRFADEVP
jgi:hypothetical protein